ncbi:MAG TPA: SRPBCC family protein [Mycobacteriales bacterium]|jgi:uncharacterized protein YndB with AHSA1/START domain|nr:SRPBCC family protein [Mycobacteriales bacterium]
MRTDGELARDGDAFVLRFERDLPHPIEQVWQTITEPKGLEAWFPATVSLELRVGGQVAFANDPDFDVDPELLAFSGEVKELDPQRCFAFTWGTDLLRFELVPTDDGCRLVFTHRLAHRAMVNRTVAGWSVCLDGLSSSLGDEEATPGWRAYYDHYAAAFGDGGWVERDGESTIVRFERLMPACAETVRSTLAVGAPELDPNPGGEVKWQLIPIGETSLLLLTHTITREIDEDAVVDSWDRQLKGLSAALA